MKLKLRMSPSTGAEPTRNLSATDLEGFLTCPQKYAFFTEHRLASKFINPNMLLGSAVHAGLASYYRRVAIAPSEIAALYLEREVGKLLSQGFMLTTEIDTLIDSSREILDYYIGWSKKRDQEWEILGVEMPFALSVLTDRTIVGVIDLLVRDWGTGKIWIVDHKTTSRSVDMENTTGYTFGMQSYLYPWALNNGALVGKKQEPYEWGHPVHGVIYNVIASNPPEQPRILKNGSLSKDKAQRTTMEMYVAALKEMELPTDGYEDVLASLSERRYNERIPVEFDAGRSAWFGTLLTKALTQIANAGLRVEAAPAYTCAHCDYRVLCEEGIRRGKNWQLLTMGSFLPREQYDLFEEEG